jgi:glycine oxidase
LYDVVIIGGGIIGLATSLELQRRGLKTLVVDRGAPGDEASSAAGGMLAPQIEASHPASGPGPAFKLGLLSREMYAVLSREMYAAWVATIESLSHSTVGYHADGALDLVEGEEALEAAWTKARSQKELGLRVERLDRAKVLEMIPGLGDAISGAIHFPDEAQVDPRRLMRALSLAARAAGAEVWSGATVQQVVFEQERVAGLDLEDQHLAAKTVVVAAGSWSALLPGTELPLGVVRPARGQMLLLDAGKPPCIPYFFVGQKGYVVPRRDGRVVVGSTTEHVGYNKSVTAQGMHHLLSMALRALPALGEARVIETWSGFRPWTPDHLPILGRTRIEGLFLATGHFRNGIVQAPGTARLLADLVTGKRPDIDPAPFSVARFSPPIGRKTPAPAAPPNLV